MKLTLVKARKNILGLFIISFLITLFVAFVALGRDIIDLSAFGDLIFNVIKIYAVPIGLIVTYLLKDDEKANAPKMAFYNAAITLCVIWNGLLLGRLIYFSFWYKEDTIDLLFRFLNRYVESGMVIIIGFITYFFSHPKGS